MGDFSPVRLELRGSERKTRDFFSVGEQLGFFKELCQLMGHVNHHLNLFLYQIHLAPVHVDMEDQGLGQLAEQPRTWLALNELHSGLPIAFVAADRPDNLDHEIRLETDSLDIRVNVHSIQQEDQAQHVLNVILSLARTFEAIFPDQTKQSAILVGVHTRS